MAKSIVNNESLREGHFEALAYIAVAPIKVVISSPLVAEDNQTAIGSCFLIEGENLA